MTASWAQGRLPPMCKEIDRKPCCRARNGKNFTYRRGQSVALSNPDIHFWKKNIYPKMLKNLRRSLKIEYLCLAKMHKIGFFHHFLPLLF